MPSRVLCFSGSKGINLTPLAVINAKGRPASFGFSPLLPGTKPRLELRAGPIKILEFKDGFILDGFPRNINQAHKLDEALTKINKKIHKVFSFEIDDDIIVKRLSGRYSCKKCGTIYNKYYSQTKIHGYCDKCNSIDFETRSDDNEITIKKRLEVFKESSFPLIDYYKKKHLLVSIDALKIAPLIFEHLLSSINS